MENIFDIAKELWEFGDRPPPRFVWFDLSKRLESLYEEVVDSLKWKDETIEIYKMENEKLKKALDEVLSVKPKFNTICRRGVFDIAELTYDSKECVAAVGEAQRIYNEEMNK